MGPSSISVRAVTAFMAATASRKGAGSTDVTGATLPCERVVPPHHRCTLHRRWRASQRSTVDLSADRPRQARRFVLCRGPSHSVPAEFRGSFLAVCGEPFLHVRATEAEACQAERGLEWCPEHGGP